MRISTRELILVAMFAALTAWGAWLKIPLQPVPFTFQIFFTLLAGAALGPFLGALSQLIYVLLGVAGLPVFAGSNNGAGALIGPTGGYLMGFILAGFLIGFLVRRLELRSLYSVFASMLAGLVVIYLIGALQLKVVLNLSVYRALVAGVLPFVFLDLVKAALAAVVAVRLQKVL